MSTPLHVERRDRVLSAMAEADLDVLVLGEQANVVYASGHHRLWTAGTRPHAPTCIVVRRTGATHLLSTWDEGVPADVPFEHLFGITWNPEVMGAALAAIPGLSDARRLGVDGMTAGFLRAVERLAPGAELVVADNLLADARRTKFPAEVDLMRAACRVAAAGLDAVGAALPAPDAAAAAVAVDAMARAGSTRPVGEPLVRTTGGTTVVDLGVLVEGYEGGIGRTLGDDPEGTAAVHRRTLAACRPGTTAPGSGSGTTVEARGAGLGAERPVVGTLEAGMVVSVTTTVGAHRWRDLVLVADEPRPLLGGAPVDGDG
jgi:Xaa-Pro aminopeptidase